MSSKIIQKVVQQENNSLINLRNTLFGSLGGGPKILPMRYVINFQKGLTLFYVMFLMYYYNNTSLGCYLYLSAHGSYGFLWLIKDFVFPDKSWEGKGTIGTLLFIQTGLILYWILPWMMACGIGIQNPSNTRVFIVFFVYIIGVVLMLLSDSQKYYTLKYKKGLIDDGMFKLTRNPNYLGEILVYLSFGICVGNFYGYGILIFIWSTIFSLNIYCKEKSFQQKLGWDQYQKNSNILLPKIFKNVYIDWIFYTGVAYFFYKDYEQGGFIQFVINYFNKL